METSSLKHLLAPAPTCAINDTLATLALTFGHSDQQAVVIVNENQHPVGVITLTRFLPYLLMYGLPNPYPHPSSPWQQPLMQTLLPAIEPINTIPVDWDLLQFQEYFQMLSPSLLGTPYALVQADGSLVGLLNSQCLLQYLLRLPTSESPLSTSSTSVYPNWSVCQVLLTKTESNLTFGQPPTLSPQNVVGSSYNSNKWETNSPSALPWTEDFLASISHELKTPLTALLGLSALLKDELTQSASNRQANYARLIHQSGRQLMVLVNDLVDWTRLERGEIEILHQSISIEELCYQAWEQVKETFDSINSEASPSAVKLSDLTYTHHNLSGASESQLEALLPSFEIEIEPGLDLITADELRLRQILINLITSAYNVTDATGKVGLQVSHWHPQWIGFTVWDTGATIRPVEQPFIGQRFQSRESISEPIYDRLLTQNAGTTSLSLMLTHQLVKLHRGDITFTSCGSQGNQFTVLLPSSSHPSSEKPASLLAQSSVFVTSSNFETAPCLALIGETDPDRILELIDLLTPLNYRVLVARSRQEVFTKARQFQPSVILINLTDPLLAGSELLTQLKTDGATRHLQAIAYYLDSEKLALESIPIHDLLSYPIESVTLQQKLYPHRSTPTPIPPLSRLTILCLTPNDPLNFDALERPSSSLYLSALPAQKHRIIEASDIDQAELLVRIWKPDILLVDEAELPDPLLFFQDLSHRCLASLPLVTLTPETTQAANQVPGLKVFPCLAPSEPLKLLQVIQVAAGFGS